MNLRNLLKNALLFLLLYFSPSHVQKAARELDVPELQLLASNLKPEECVKLVALYSHSSLSAQQIENLAREQSCFRRLVTWVCQLRTKTRNTHSILNNLLKLIGREDLISCLAEFSVKNSNPPKVVRDVQAVENADDYDSLAQPTTLKPKERGSKSDLKAGTSSNQTIEKLFAHTLNLSLKTAIIFFIATMLITCCCTLFIRNRVANLCNRIRGKKKKGKFIPIEDDGGNVSRSYFVRKPREKRKRAPSYELVHTSTQNDPITVARELEEPPTTGCYKCYKKKRKKHTRKPYR